MIPNVPHCRFITIAQINEKVATDDFKYKEVRVVGKVHSLKDPVAFLKDPFDESGEQELKVNIYKLKGKEIEEGKIYEFMGEIEVEANTGTVFLNARILKTGQGFHKTVYKETTEQVNALIESIMSRN